MRSEHAANLALAEQARAPRPVHRTQLQTDAAGWVELAAIGAAFIAAAWMLAAFVVGH